RDVLDGARDLARYLRGESRDVPDELALLQDDELLSLVSWLAYFSALPECILVRPSPHDAITGFRILKRWPKCFGQTLRQLVNPGLMDEQERIAFFEKAVISIGRVGSTTAQGLIVEMLTTELWLSGGVQWKSSFIKPVADFSGSAQ